MSSEKCPSDKTPRWASSWVHFLSSAPSLWRLENKKPPQCFFTRSQKNQKTNAAGRRSASFCCFLHENAALRRCNGSSPQTAFICRPAGGEEERCCVFSSRWKINFYSCATDCFSAAGEEEEEEEEGEEALEFIKCSIVDRIQFVSIPENELSRRMEVMEDDGGDGGWWRWWRWWRCVALCVWLNSTYTHRSHWQLQNHFDGAVFCSGMNGVPVTCSCSMCECRNTSHISVYFKIQVYYR